MLGPAYVASGKKNKNNVVLNMHVFGDNLLIIGLSVAVVKRSTGTVHI